MILKMQAELCQNAASVPTTLGNGVDGHLCLVMNPAEYTNRTGVLFQPPANPGAIPIILAGNDAQRAQQVRQHAEQLCIYNAHNHANSFSQLLIHCTCRHSKMSSRVSHLSPLGTCFNTYFAITAASQTNVWPIMMKLSLLTGILIPPSKVSSNALKMVHA